MALYIDNNVNNMTFVRSYYCLLPGPKINDMPSKIHVVPLLAKVSPPNLA